MLVPILLASVAPTLPQIFVALLGVAQMPGNRIEFVISYYCKGAIRVDHPANDIDRLELVRTPVAHTTSAPNHWMPYAEAPR